MKAITIIRPDDWHLHIRDGATLKTVLPATAEVFGRAIIMPNLRPPIVTMEQARRYQSEIMAALPSKSSFQPLMTLYLTDATSPDDVAAGKESGLINAVKLYPANATTNSEHGVSDLKRVAAVLARMEKIGLPLLVHGEVTDPEVDIFDREKVFLDRVLPSLRRDFPELKIVLEHATTQEAIDYVRAESASGHLAATITAHHLHINRNAIFTGGIRPHFYCLPIAKREQHRLALIKAATSGESCFFLGTDSAPHPQTAKESACGCAGIYTAPLAMPLYAAIFAQADRLDNLEKFASLNGPRFYGLAPNPDRITLRQTAQPIPALACVGAEKVTPFFPPRPLDWEVA